MMDVVEEMSLQRSIYHFYLWKEAQTLEYERSLWSGRTRFNSFIEGDAEADIRNESIKNESPIADSDNENENGAPKVTRHEEGDSTTNYDNIYNMSAKYRRVLNVLKDEFPSIDFGCPPVTLIPDVYIRYSMYPKLCRDCAFQREQHGTESAPPTPQEGNVSNSNYCVAVAAAATAAPTTDVNATALTESKKRKHPGVTTVASIAEEEDHSLHTKIDGDVMEREDVPVDVKEQFVVIQNEAQEQEKKVISSSLKMEEQMKRHVAIEQQREIRLDRQRALLEKRKRVRLGVSDSPEKSSDVKIGDAKSSKTKNCRAKSSIAKCNSEKPSKGNDSDNRDNDKMEDKFPESFEERLELLKHFQEEHGHCRVPKTHNFRLNAWLSHLRKSYRKMQKEARNTGNGSDGENYNFSNTPMGLTTERVRKLEEIGFEWFIQKTQCLTWDERYEQLKEFKEKHGHCSVLRYFEENKALGEWVHWQRQNRAKKLPKLTPERIAKLDALGFVWRVNVPKKVYNWEFRLRQCAEFRRKYGHLKVPPVNAKKENGEMPDEEELRFRRWAKTQRKEYQRHTQGLRSVLDTKRIKQLKSLEFSFDFLPRGKKKKSDQSNNKTMAASTVIPDNNDQASPPKPFSLADHTQNDVSRSNEVTMNEVVSAVQAFDGGDDDDKDESSSVDATDNDGRMP